MKHCGASGGDLYQQRLLFWHSPHPAKTETEIDRHGDSAGEEKTDETQVLYCDEKSKRARNNRFVFVPVTIPYHTENVSLSALEAVQQSVEYFYKSVTLCVSASLIETSITLCPDVSSTSLALFSATSSPQASRLPARLNPRGRGDGEERRWLSFPIRRAMLKAWLRRSRSR